MVRVLSILEPLESQTLFDYHYYIKSLVDSQYESESYFVIADLLNVIQDFRATKTISNRVRNTIINILSCGIDPAHANIFVQSHCELQTQMFAILTSIVPIKWLIRLPQFKNYQKNHINNVATYGILGYSLMQTAIILLYEVTHLALMKNQTYILELTREVARRFNHLYGLEPFFRKKADTIIKKLGKKQSIIYRELLLKYQQNGDDEALQKAEEMLSNIMNISNSDRNRLLALLENKSKVILIEPIANITQEKSLNINRILALKSINLRDDEANIWIKLKKIPTDQARVYLHNPGNPTKCPIFQLHLLYNSKKNINDVELGCKTATISCLDCKKMILEPIVKEQSQFIENAKSYTEDDTLITKIIIDGAEKSDIVAKQTINKVKEVISLIY